MSDEAPAWFGEMAYAETFHCHPQDVARIVPSLWWERWQWYARAMAARAVSLKVQGLVALRGAVDFTKDLSESERNLLQWIDTDDGD